MTTLAGIVAVIGLVAVLVIPRMRRGELRYRDVLLFAVAFTLPLRDTPVLPFAGGNIRLGDIFLLMAVAVFALERILVRDRVRLTQIDVLLILFVVWCFCTIAWSLDPSFGLTRALKYLRNLCLYAVVVYWSRDRFTEAFRAVSAGVLASFALLFVNAAIRLFGSYALYRMFTGHDRANDIDFFRSQSALGAVTWSTEATILVLSLWANIGIFLWLARGGWSSARRSERVLFPIVLGALLVLQLATFARGGWLGLAIAALCWIVWIGPELRRRLIVTTAVLLILTAAAAYSLNLHEAVLKRVGSFVAGGQDESIVARFIYWTLVTEALEERPIGVGIGGTTVTVQKPAGTWFVHNLYLQLLAELGPIGLALFLGSAALAIVQALQRARAAGDPRLRLVACSLAAILASYLVMGLTYLDFSDLEIWLVMALATAIPKPGPE